MRRRLGRFALGVWGTIAMSPMGMSEGFALPTNPNVRHELVLIVDQGIDFRASELLRAKRATNYAELIGRSGVDDDGNGFVDDLSGWNIISNSPDFIPQWISAFFDQNLAPIQELLRLLESKTSLDARQKSLLAEISELGHGTHVAGIVAQYSSPHTKILSANLQSSGHNSSSELLTTMSTTHLAEENIRSSIFDTKERTVAVLKNITRTSFRQADTLNRYIQATRPAVANLSFGNVSRDEIEGQAEIFWREHLRQNSQKPSTPRSEEQQKNFSFFVANLYRYESERWTRLFRNNSNTLFVIAAGNRGKNLEEETALPANLSATFANVMTVMAIDSNGQRAHFSNFGLRSVNVAAWGVDISSSIPGGESMKMSGTSMAAPFVTALASKLRIANEKLSAADVRKILEQSVYKMGSMASQSSSGGIINFERALEMANRY